MKQPPDPSPDAEALAAARHADPFAFLGPHPTGEASATVIRVFRPDARRLWIEPLGGDPVEAERIHGDGIFQAVVAAGVEASPAAYRCRAEGFEGRAWTFADPYACGPLLGGDDCHYFREGSHERLYDALGSHATEVDGIAGRRFAVWAPNARRVSLVGDFNRWDGRVHPMRFRVEAGVWELFVPGVGPHLHYKFEVVGAGGDLVLKTDPFAFFAQHGPETSSITWDLDRYEWGDRDWMESRPRRDAYGEPMSIYEVHLGSWARRPEEGNRMLTYREFADELVDYVVEQGFTHIELMPVSEFPFDGSWGYQVTGYFAPTSRFGNPDDFRFFVDRCHQRGIGVIVDWVPAHFPKDVHGLARFDGTSLYEHADPRQGEHTDWGTLIFNYGRHEVCSFLVSSAMFWFEQYHIDGLRVDAVASMLYLDYSRNAGEWVPNRFGGRENLEAIEFLRQLNQRCYARFPGIAMIAEESTAWGGVSRPTAVGGLGFGFKWNMGWMHDFLEFMSRDPVHRRFHHHEATFPMIYAYDENFILVLSHDEVVHGKRSLLDKMPGDFWQKFANLRLFYAWMFAHPGKKLLFQGGEIGQWREWDFQSSIDWHLLQYDEHRGLQRLVADLNRLYRERPALHDCDHRPDGFEWIVHSDTERSVYAFIRWSANRSHHVVAVLNATPVPRPGYRLGVPSSGRYREILNSDSEIYGGSNMGNAGGVEAADVHSHGRPQSIEVTIPPLGAVILEPEPAQ